MRLSLTLMAGAAIVAVTLSSPVFSQGSPQTLSVMKVLRGHGHEICRGAFQRTRSKRQEDDATRRH
jgi:hypothetical protein